MSKFDCCLYCCDEDIMNILESLLIQTVRVPKEVMSGDMDLCLHIKGTIKRENEKYYFVQMNDEEFFYFTKQKKNCLKIFRFLKS